MAECLNSKASSMTHRTFNKSGSPQIPFRDPSVPIKSGFTPGPDGEVNKHNMASPIQPREATEKNYRIDMQAQTTFYSGIDKNELASKIQ